ncbi:MAG: flagellar hook-associated protein FlgK [Gammaproteobacteria bacterium]|nr:flagellar hook-associated protein FlgK [Gammaproteobacteria bacterium]
MASGVLGTATSGLLAFQRALSTTGHNIANANTPGFSRQRVEMYTQTPQTSGSGYIGTGVVANSVVRYYDQFLSERVRSNTSSSNTLDTYYQYSSRIANLMGDANAGLNGALESFFNSAQTLANDPTSVASRQLLMSEGESLASRFQYLDKQLSATRAEVNGQLDSTVQDMNSLSNSIADMNRQIVVATGRSGGQPPNDLLDKRDELLVQLSKLVSVTTLEQDDGSLNVFIGNGQSLVTGYDAATLGLTGSPYDATEKDITYTVGGVPAVITGNISGGKLGGLLAFRDEILDVAQNSLGRIAVLLGNEFNRQQALGLDLDGNLGAAFFSLGTPQASGNIGNTGTGTVTASFDTANISALTTKDYLISYNGATWDLTDTDGNAVTMTGAGTVGSPFLAQGLSIVVGGAAAAGDQFQIRPTRDSARLINMAMTSTRGIAAAAPVRMTEATNANGLPTNGGTGEFSYSGVNNGYTALAANVTFTFNSGTNQLVYTDGGAVNGTLAYNPATDSGNSFSVAGVNFKVTGTPANGDAFVLGNNTNGAGDNGNALLLAGLQTSLTVENGTANFQGAYAQLISDVGTRTRQADISGTAQRASLSQAQLDRDALSGVNLDEEAANLVRFQQAYQAMAQVINVADSMFQTLLNSIGR